QPPPPLFGGQLYLYSNIVKDSREQTGTLISPGDIHSSLRTSVDTVKHEAASTFSCDEQQHPLNNIGCGAFTVCN
uniref:Uncharacterized protein n=1 Tax=Sparus aurata TaxID=8175 RepID=A0A671V3N9_SPAAU